jgi:NAD(P)H-flavin reductase
MQEVEAHAVPGPAIACPAATGIRRKTIERMRARQRRRQRVDLEGLEHGGHIDASGPYGRFCLGPGDSNQRYLLIGTGTGVTPYRAMLPLIEQQIAARDIRVVLLFGARTPAEVLYGDEFRAFAERHPAHFRFVPCLSRELPDAPHPDVRHGYVQQFLGEFAPDAAGDIAYLCGNPNMVDACFEALKGHGLAVPQIRREKYVSSK